LGLGEAMTYKLIFKSGATLEVGTDKADFQAFSWAWVKALRRPEDVINHTFSTGAFVLLETVAGAGPVSQLPEDAPAENDLVRTVPGLPSR